MIRRKLVDSLEDLTVPRAQDYFGLWAIYEDVFRAMVQRFNRIDLGDHIRAQTARRPEGLEMVYEVLPGGIAIVPLHGVLMKQLSSLEEGTSTVVARRQLRLAAQDKEVTAILLHIDSPGGTHAGTADLADEVIRARGQKPVAAYIEDIGASAAYWVASQAEKIYAGRTAMIGSIGTYAVIEDLSARAAMLGIKVHVLRTGRFKGAGVAGTEIEQRQLDEWQRLVEESAQFFFRAVAAGRRMKLDAILDLADGRVHIGQAAVELGLIDGVQSLADTVEQLKSKIRSASTMSANDHPGSVIAVGSDDVSPVAISAPLEEKPASYKELVAACIGADSEFLCSQLEKGATLGEATAAWIAEQNARIARAEKEAGEAWKASAVPGVDPLAGGKTAAADKASDAIDAFTEQVAQKMDQGMKRAAAIRAIVREDPELHEAYIEAYNAQAR